MKRVSRWALGSVLVLGLAAAAWFGWGAWLSAKFDDRLATMRAAGTLQTWDDLRLPESAPGTNGWALLGEAAEILRAVEGERIGGEHDDALDESPPVWIEDEPWTPEERADAGRYLVRLTPYFHALEEVLGADALQEPHGTPWGGGGEFWHLGNALNAWYLAGRHDPQRTIWALDRMVRALDRWVPSGSIDPLLYPIWWTRKPMALLRDGLSAELDPSRLREAWAAAFARAEAKLGPLLTLNERRGRAVAVDLLQAWRRGEDPTRGVRTKVRSMADILPDVEGKGLEELKAFLGAAGALEPPWYTRWYGRPRLQQLALELLDDFEHHPLRDWQLADMRFQPDHGVIQQTERIRALMLRTTASLRLARIALVAREIPVSLRADATSFQRAARERMGGKLPQDPIDGGAFVWEVVDGRWTVGARPTPAHAQVFWGEESLEGRALKQRLREEVLLWTIPAR